MAVLQDSAATSELHTQNCVHWGEMSASGGAPVSHVISDSDPLSSSSLSSSSSSYDVPIDFVAGSLGATASVYVGQPLDTLKVKIKSEWMNKYKVLT